MCYFDLKSTDMKVGLALKFSYHARPHFLSPTSPFVVGAPGSSNSRLD